MPTLAIRSPRRAAIQVNPSVTRTVEEEDEARPDPNATGTTGGLVPQQAGTWRKKEPEPIQWAGTAAERKQQVMDRLQADYEARVQKAQPFKFNAHAPKLREEDRFVQNALSDADRDFREQAVGERERAVLEQKTRNAAMESDFRKAGKRLYKDEFGNFVPEVDETGRQLYHKVERFRSAHPKTKEPAWESRDQYGQRQFVPMPLSMSADALDENAVYDIGDGESQAGPSYKELTASNDNSKRRLGMAIRKRLNGARASEALAQMEGLTSQIELEHDMAENGSKAALQQAEALSAAGGDPAQVQKFYDESDKLKQSVAPLALRRNMARAGLAEERARLKRDQYIENREEIAEHVRQKGGVPEDSPTYQANEADLAKWEGIYQNSAKLRGGVEQLMRPVGGRFETPLTPKEESAFQKWKQRIAPNDSGADYDFRGAFKAGLKPGEDGHWPDTYKKPNHPTFSDESIYAKDAPEKAGHWENGEYIAPGARGGTVKQTAKAVVLGATAKGLYATSEGGARLFAGSPVRRGMEALEDWATEKIQGFPLTDQQKQTRAKLRQRAQEQTGAATLDRFALDYAKATGDLRGQISRALPVDQKFAQSKLGQIAQGAGQLVGTLPMATLGPGGIAAASVGQIYDEAYQDAKQSGADDATAHSAAMKYLPAAGLDFLADRLVIGKLLKPLRGKMTVGQFIKDILTTAAVEGTTEGAQQLYLNQIASKLEGYDKNRKFDQEVYDSALVGAVVGGGATTVGTGGRMLAQPPADRPTSPPTTPGPPDGASPVAPVGPADAPALVDAELDEVLGRPAPGATPVDAAAAPSGNFPVTDAAAPPLVTAEQLEEQVAAKGQAVPTEAQAAPEAPVPVGTTEPLVVGETPAPVAPAVAPPPVAPAGPKPPVTMRIRRKSGRWVDVTMTAEQAEAYRKKQGGAPEPIATPPSDVPAVPPGAPVAVVAPAQPISQEPAKPSGGTTPTPPEPTALAPATESGRPPVVSATPEQVAQDRLEYDRLQAEMKTKVPLSPEYNALWKKAEAVKNRHGGFVPEVQVAPAVVTPAAGGKTIAAKPSVERTVVSGMKRPELRAELEAAGVTTLQGKPLADANPAQLMNAVGKLRSGKLVEDAAPAFTLPRDLAGAKPRYSYGDKQFELQFESDLDKAAYILAQKTPSKRDSDYLKAVMETGMSESAARAHGATVRDKIKAMAKDADGGEALTVSNTPQRTSDRVIEAIRKAKIDTRGKAFDVTAALPIQAYNTALDLAIAAIKAGRSIAEAVRLAVARYRALHRAATDDDVARLTAAIESAGQKPEPTPTGGPAVPGVSGQSFTGPVNPGAPEFRRRSKSAIGEYEYVSTTNTGQDKYAQEFADWHEKNGTPESAIAEMRSINEPAFRATVAAELLARALNAESTANPGDKVILNERINSLWNDVRAEKTEAAQALQAQALTNKKLEPYLPILMWKDLIRGRLETNVGKKFGEDAAGKVKKGVRDAGQEAAGALKEALEAPEGEKPKGPSASAVNAWLDKHAATLTLLRKAAKSRDLKWADIFNDLPENQEARKAELFDRVKAEPKLKDLSEAQQKRLAESLDESWTFLRNQIFKREFSRLVQLPNIKPADAEKVKSVIGELLKYSNLGLLDNTAFLDALAEKYGMENMDGPTAKKLTDLAQKIQRAKSPAEKARAQLEMMDTFHAAKGVELKDILNSQLYANILSAYTTQLGGNIAGNIAQTVTGLTTTGLAEPTRVGALLKGWLSGMPEAWRQAQSIWSTGHGGQDAAAILAESKGDTFELMAKGEVFKELNERLPRTAKSVQNYARAMRYVSRFMRAADAMFYYPAREAYARVAAEKILEADYTGAELKAQVEKHLGVGIGDYEAAVAQAKNDGFTEKHEIARRASDIIEGRRAGSKAGQTALEQGKRFGGTVTLNKDPEGWWGVAYKHGVHFVDDFTPGGIPVAKPFMMFMRVPTNFINETLNYTPIGAIRAVQGDTITTTKKDGKYQRREFTQEEQRRLIIQSMIGTSLIGYFASRALNKKPDDEEDQFDLTATGPRDFTQRAQWQAAGNIPYSIRIPGTKTRINYQNTPLAMPLALAGHVADSVRYDNAAEGKVTDATVNTFARFPSVIFGIPMLQGLSELAEMTDQNRPNTSRTINFFKNLGKNLLMPRLLTQLNQTFGDDTVEDKGVTQYDSLGQPVTRKPYTRIISTETDDPLRSFLDSSSIVIPVPDRNITVRGDTHTLTPEQLAEFRRKSGTLIRARLTSLLSALKAMPKEQAEKRVKEVAREQIDRVRDEIKRGIRRMPRVAP